MEMTIEKARERKEASRRSFDQAAPAFDESRQGAHSRELYRHVLWELAGCYTEWLCRERREGRVDAGGVPERRFRVLDLGCGTGKLTAHVLESLPCARITAVDLSPAMVDTARERLGGRVRLFCADAERLPFAEGSFDAVLMNDVLHHLPNAGRAAFEAWRVLDHEGMLVLGDVWAPGPVRLVLNAVWPRMSAGDVCARSEGELRDLLGRWFSEVGWRRVGAGSCVALARKAPVVRS